jgi:hypothetical protein
LLRSGRNFPMMVEVDWPIGGRTEVFRSMATLAFPRVFRPALTQRKSKELPSFSPGNAVPQRADLTIHRITPTHHGRTLLILGHAAEYLANSRRFTILKFEDTADEEAIHILMGLSRQVFEEFAEKKTEKRRVGDWLIERVVRLLE